MWSDNDIDNAFRRLDPAEPEPRPFPLDAWLKLEAGLDQAVIDRAVRRRLWQFFAAEVAVVALLGLGWSLWPTSDATSAIAKSQTVAYASSPVGKATDTKRVKTSSDAQLTAAPNTRLESTNRLAARISHSTTPPPAATAAPTEPSAATAAAVAPISPAGATNELQPHSPLTVALAPSRHSAPATRASLADAPFVTLGHVNTVLVGPNAGRAEMAMAAQKTARQFGNKPSDRQALAAQTDTQAGAQILAHNDTDVKTQSAGRFTGTPMAAPTPARATAGEVAVADAASPSGSPTTTTSVGQSTAGRAATAANVSSGSIPEDGGRQSDATADGLLSATTLTVDPLLLAAEPLPTQLALTEPTILPLPAVVREPRFYVGVVAAPDVSTVKFAEVKGAGLNLGLTLEYRLGQRWHLATGLQRATKDYYARREDYDWTDYPRAQTRDFNWVEGACTVLDVPVNLRYDAVVQAHARWFGTAGLSSFFMQRENYSYDYLEGGTYKIWNMPGLVNANRHLFSILNLSAGYEYGLGTHWRLQAEPYVKVPLAGVGAGKVKLLSAGVYFGLKYGF